MENITNMVVAVVEVVGIFIPLKNTIVMPASAAPLGWRNWTVSPGAAPGLLG